MNWIEKATGKKLAFFPTETNHWRGGRKVTYVEFADGSEGEYYIDFENKTIEPVFPETEDSENLTF